MDIGNNLVTQDAVDLSFKVGKLVQRVRNGEVEAYNALTAGYHDSVKQSSFNMMSIYMLLAIKKTARTSTMY